MAPAFHSYLASTVEELGKRLGITSDRALAVWYGIEALHLDESEAQDAASYDGGNDRGVDFFVVDEEWERVLIAQFKNLKNPVRAPKPADLALLFDTLNELAEPQELINVGRADLAEAAEALAEARQKGFTVQLHFVYPGKQGDELDRLARRFNRQRGADGDPVSVTIVSLDDLELIHDDFVGRSGRVPEGTLNLIEGTALEQDGPYGRALVASLPGSTLRELYRAHKDRLFDQNVRLFLGKRKGSVNAGIRETLQDANERGNFWAYNNGITVIAGSFDLADDQASVVLTDFSIVNGCQTTVSLADAGKDADDATVLARVIAAPNRDLVDRVIKFTNSQTPINIWDISARDHVQQRLQRELGEMDPPWFYALRRGELSRISDRSRYGRGDERRVLPFPQSAQFLAAMRGMPVEAYKDKSRLFTSLKERVFSADVHAGELLWAWVLGQQVEIAVRAYGEKFDSSPVVASILKRGARFFATAVAAQLLRIRNGSDFTAKVTAERLGDKALLERIAKYSYLGVAWYVAIVRAAVESGQDLSVLLRNTDTASMLVSRVEEKMHEEELAPEALKEKLPLLPGVRKGRALL